MSQRTLIHMSLSSCCLGGCIAIVNNFSSVDTRVSLELFQSLCLRGMSFPFKLGVWCNPGKCAIGLTTGTMGSGLGFVGITRPVGDRWRMFVCRLSQRCRKGAGLVSGSRVD